MSLPYAIMALALLAYFYFSAWWTGGMIYPL